MNFRWKSSEYIAAMLGASWSFGCQITLELDAHMLSKNSCKMPIHSYNKSNTNQDRCRGASVVTQVKDDHNWCSLEHTWHIFCCTRGQFLSSWQHFFRYLLSGWFHPQIRNLTDFLTYKISCWLFFQLETCTLVQFLFCPLFSLTKIKMESFKR